MWAIMYTFNHLFSRTRSKSFPADFYSSSKEDGVVDVDDDDDEEEEEAQRGTYLDEEFFLIDWKKPLFWTYNHRVLVMGKMRFQNLVKTIFLQNQLQTVIPL